MHSSRHVRQLIGRSREQNLLGTSLQHAQQSKGQVALIVGEAGIGKTRLLTDLIGLAETSHMTILRGECVEQDQDFPYAPIIDGLRTHFSGLTPEELQSIIDPFQTEILRLLPELTLRMAETGSGISLEPEAEKRRLFEVLVQIYQRLAGSGLLLIFEDVHWADANSLDFFQTLTRRISKLPVMVVLSSRLTTPHSEVASLRLYLDRAENAQSILLNPLTESETEQLIQAVLQTTEAIHPYFLERLNPLVQGNPLYTEQIVYTLMQNRQLSLVNGTWMITSSTNLVEIPNSIKQIVEQQLMRLSEPARQVLQFAAVAGRQFELKALQQLTGFDRTLLTEVVKELLTRRFLVEVSRDRFVFRHALLRQAIYDSLLIREQQERHYSLLRILEDTGSFQSDTQVAELSHHAFRAEAWDAARFYGFQAGQHALSLHSPRAAIEHFSHAVEATLQLGERVSWDLAMQRGKAYDSVGEFRRALDDYEAALQIAKHCGDQAAEWQTLIAAALLWSARDYQRTGDYCRRALQLAQSIGEPKLIGHSLNRMGNWYLNIGQPSEALGYHEQALAVFEALDDPAGKGETLDLLGMTTGHVLQLHAQQAYYRDAVVIFRALDDRKALASSLANLALCALDPALAGEAIDIAHQIGWYGGEAYACVTAGYVHSFYGHFIQSLSYLHRSQELAQAIDHKQWLAGAHVFSGFVYRELLELETAADQVEKGITLASAVGSHWYSEMGRGLLARIRIGQGQLDAAAELLAQHEVPDPPAMQHLVAMMAEAELALARGDAPAALLSNERLRSAWSVDHDSLRLSVFLKVPYLTTQTKAMIILGRHNAALEPLKHVRNICMQEGLLPALWQVEVLLGQVTAQMDEAAAQQCFQRARACVSQLAERVPADIRQRFQRNAEKIIPYNPRRDETIASHHQLTQREMDIIREVASGKSNQQIADTLHITVKTVETHLTRILSKLNMTSRTQVALWAAENKLILPSD